MQSDSDGSSDGERRTLASTQRYVFYSHLELGTKTEVILLTHVTDQYSVRQIDLLDATLGKGVSLAYANIPEKGAPSKYAPITSRAYQSWTTNDSEILKKLSPLSPEGGLLLGRALQAIGASSDAEFVWLIENDVYF